MGQLLAWARRGEAPEPGRLALTRGGLDRASLDVFLKAATPNEWAPTRLRIAVAEDGSVSDPAELVSIDGFARRLDLLKLAEARAAETIGAHPALGPLQKHPRFGWLMATVTWERAPVRMVFGGPAADPPKELLEAGARYLGRAAEISALARDAAAAQLLAIYNDAWRAPDAPILSPDAFKAALQLEMVEITPQGGVTLCFGCGALFADHGVTVGSADGRTDFVAGIEG